MSHVELFSLFLSLSLSHFSLFLSTSASATIGLLLSAMFPLLPPPSRASFARSFVFHRLGCYPASAPPPRTAEGFRTGPKGKPPIAPPPHREGEGTPVAVTVSERERKRAKEGEREKGERCSGQERKRKTERKRGSLLRNNANRAHQQTVHSTKPPTKRVQKNQRKGPVGKMAAACEKAEISLRRHRRSAGPIHTCKGMIRAAQGRHCERRWRKRRREERDKGDENKPVTLFRFLLLFSSLLLTPLSLSPSLSPSLPPSL